MVVGGEGGSVTEAGESIGMGGACGCGRGVGTEPKPDVLAFEGDAFGVLEMRWLSSFLAWIQCSELTSAAPKLAATLRVESCVRIQSVVSRRVS